MSKGHIQKKKKASVVKQPSAVTVIEVVRKPNGHYDPPVSTESSESSSESDSDSGRKSSTLKKDQVLELKGFTTDEQNTESESDEEENEPGRLKRSQVIDFQVQLKSKSSKESSSANETSDSDTSNDEVKKPEEITYANLSEIQPKFILPEMTPEVNIPDVTPKVIIPEVTPKVIPEVTTEFEVQPFEVITEIQHPKIIIPDVTQKIIPEVTQKVIPEVEVRPDVIQDGQRRSSLLREVSIDDGFEIQMCVPAVVRTRCGIFSFCLLSFPQNERKIYKLSQLSLSQFVYFLREVCLLFNF